jgi:hypothetical protein
MDAKAAGFYETAVFWQPPNRKHELSELIS